MKSFSSLVPEKPSRTAPKHSDFFDAAETLRAHDISRKTDQMKRDIKDEVNSLLQGKSLAKRRETG